MKVFLKKVWHVVKNKYVATTLLFLLFILFLSENNVIVIHRLNREVSQLKKEAELLEQDIRRDSVEAVSLSRSKEALEAYGREHYYMKRPNEDIFVIKDEK